MGFPPTEPQRSPDPDPRRLAGMGAFADALRPPKWETRFETLKADESAWEELTEERSIVKTGDPVEEIMSQDDLDESDSHATDAGEDLT
jgi:hypothetical protein